MNNAIPEIGDVIGICSGTASQSRPDQSHDIWVGPSSLDPLTA